MTGRRGALPVLVALVAAIALCALIVALAGASPWEAFTTLFDGAFGKEDDISDTLLTWAPLMLAAAGLSLTFAAGMWNIGIDGQITAGAIAATLAAREVGGPSPVVVPAILIAGIIGGVAWGLAAGFLRTHGGVNEIFGGLGLDFVARGMLIYLIIGPWKRAGVASTGGTEVFRDEAALPAAGVAEWSWLALGLAFTVFVAVVFLLRGTRYGLRLKAVGAGPDSAKLLGIPTRRYLLSAFALCGACAGLAGAIQVAGFLHKLQPGVSGGYGFLAILVVLLVNFRTVWTAPVALFFAAVLAGSSQLELRLDLDSSLSGVLQGVLVLFVLFASGWQNRRTAQVAA